MMSWFAARRIYEADFSLATTAAVGPRDNIRPYFFLRRRTQRTPLIIPVIVEL